MPVERGDRAAFETLVHRYERGVVQLPATVPGRCHIGGGRVSGDVSAGAPENWPNSTRSENFGPGCTQLRRTKPSMRNVETNDTAWSASTGAIKPTPKGTIGSLLQLLVEREPSAALNLGARRAPGVGAADGG